MSDLRRIHRRRFSRNPETKSVDHLGGNDEYHHLCEEDECVESFELEEKTASDCGCFGEPAGRCAEPGCGRTSCERCHAHCGGSQNQVPEGCGMPVCRRHRYYYTMPDGRNIPFCRDCYGRLVRRNRWRLVGRTFVDLDAQSNGKEIRHG